MNELRTTFSVNNQTPSNGTQKVQLSPMASALLNQLHGVGKGAHNADPGDWYAAAARLVRRELLPTWEATKEAYRDPSVKQAYYISIEWLLGPNSHTALHAAGLEAGIKDALRELGQSPEKVLGYEMDPGLGNGGLGRLAACFIDSGANLHLPIQGFGLMYDDGFFRQAINAEGHQEEHPDKWAEDGNPWGFERPEISYKVNLYRDFPVELTVTAHDMMVPSYDGRTANTLRLWRVNVPENFDSGNAEINEVIREINRSLYPKDEDEKGKNLRLAQEYVLVSASLRNIIERHLDKHPTIHNLAESTSIQINDTHPALAVPELMRILVDEHGIDWESAKAVTRSVCNYTNHTLMGEALEKWHEGKIDYVLPRLGQIMTGLHNDLMAEVDIKFAEADPAVREQIKDRVAIQHSGHYRMGHLAAFYSSKVNGVSAMHTDLIYKELFSDLAMLRGPDIKINHTNGISQRRFLKKANPELADLVTEALGTEEWITNLELLEGLRSYQSDPAFLDRFAEIKRNNKVLLGRLVNSLTGVQTNPDALFDVQVKRIHDYKRQLMNVLQTAALYRDILENPDADRTPVVRILAGKAAPSYERAKRTIALTSALAAQINSDPRIGDRLKLAFLPDYNVSKAEIIIPGADLSQQISTAGTEASGTSNMKFALDGALTLGTRDGANVEIGEMAGEDNIFFFGMTKQEVNGLRSSGYRPGDFIRENPRLENALRLIEETGFGDLARFVREEDPYMIAADFADYEAKHEAARALYYRDPNLWVQKALINTIAGSHFSSDRTIQSYNRHNWGLKEVLPHSVHDLEHAYLARLQESGPEVAAG